MIPDDLFMSFARGETNPAEYVGLTSGYNDTDDMAGNMLILYALTVGMRASNILEIGVDDGTSTLAFLQGLAAINNHGSLTSIDPAPCEAAHMIVDHFDLGDYWTHWPMKSDEYTTTTDDRFDIAFIDGDHTYEGSSRDANRFMSHVKEDGFLILHDSTMARVHDDIGCAKTVLDFLWDDRWQGIVLPFARNLAIFQRKTYARELIENDLVLSWGEVVT